MLNIVLHEPEIPENTGNIGRTCAATGTALHLIDPLGFRINEKSIKRAGMDYWEKLDVKRYINYKDFIDKKEDKTRHNGYSHPSRAIGMFSIDHAVPMCHPYYAQYKGY